MKKRTIPQYTGQSLPDPIARKLEFALNIPDLSKLKGAKLTIQMKEMNKKIKEKLGTYDTDPEKFNPYKKYFTKEYLADLRDGYDVFTHRTLLRYFSRRSPIKTSMLTALKIFLDYTPEQIDQLDFEKPEIETQNAILSAFSGRWYSYIYFDDGSSATDKIWRTTLTIEEIKKTTEGKQTKYLDVLYNGLNGLNEGVAELSHNCILITLKNPRTFTSIFLCAEVPEIPEGAGLASEPILNAYTLAHAESGKPVFSACILVKIPAGPDGDQQNNYKSFLKKNPVKLNYNELSQEKGKTSRGAEHVQTWQERQIISYLDSRHFKLNSHAKAFSPNSFHELESRNSSFESLHEVENYGKLKSALENFILFAFNRFTLSNYEIRIFLYDIHFRDQSKVVTAFRHSGDPNKIDFKGPVLLQGNKLYFLLKDNNLQRRRLFISNFKPPAKPKKVFVLPGLTVTVSVTSGAPLALREIILCIHKDEKEILQKINDKYEGHGSMSYSDFLALDMLSDDDKIYLAHPSLSTLSIPDKKELTGNYYRYNKGRKYAGEYYLYLLSNKTILSAWELSIDALSNTHLKKKDSSVLHQEVNFQGLCEVYNRSLRISLEVSEPEYPGEEIRFEFFSNPVEFIAESNRENNEWLITGRSLYTDEKDFVKSAFTAIVPKKWMDGKLNKKTTDNNGKITSVKTDKELEILRGMENFSKFESDGRS